MNKARSRILSALIAVILILSFIPTGMASAAGTIPTIGSAAANIQAPSDIAGNWAQQTIEKWLSQGLTEGYPDGTFKPDQPVTRAEFVTMVNKAFGLSDSGAASSFSDVEAGDWFYGQVSEAVYAGYTAGYPDNTFKPDSQITRAEASVMVAKAARLAAGRQAATFTDSGNIPPWAQDSVRALVAAGIIKGYPDGSFKPQDPITRAEAVVMLDKAMAPGQTAQTAAGNGISLNQTTLSMLVGSHCPARGCQPGFDLVIERRFNRQR